MASNDEYQQRRTFEEECPIKLGMGLLDYIEKNHTFRDNENSNPVFVPFTTQDLKNKGIIRQNN